MTSRVLASVLVALLLLGACGSSSRSSGARPPATSQNPDANQLQATVASFDLTMGAPDRFLVGLATGDGRLVGYGSVRVRVYAQDAKPGPYLTARFVPLPGTHPPAPMPSTPQLVDAVHGRGVYETEAQFARRGLWTAEVETTVRGLGRARASTTFSVGVAHSAVAVGQRAPATNNYTIASHAGAPLTAVDSRAKDGTVPDPELHRTTVAAALAAHRPIVVVVSTPVYCESRFCGPVTDMVDALAKQYAGKAEFVMIEVWQDYPRQQLNPSAVRWIATNEGDGTEPWVFVVGSDGVVKARFGNVVTRDELARAINQYAR